MTTPQQPDFAAAEQTAWDTENRTISADRADAEINNLARAYLALRADNERLERERDEECEARIKFGDTAIERGNELLQARADLAALREELEVNAKLLANRERECIALREDKARLREAIARRVADVGDQCFEWDEGTADERQSCYDFADACLRAAARATETEGRDA